MNKNHNTDCRRAAAAAALKTARAGLILDKAADGDLAARDNRLRAALTVADCLKLAGEEAKRHVGTL